MNVVAPPPFPVTKTLIALAGIFVAAWLWLGSGWRWDVTPRDLVEGKPPAGLRTWVGRYVRLRGVVPKGAAWGEDPWATSPILAEVRMPGEEPPSVFVRTDPNAPRYSGLPWESRPMSSGEPTRALLKYHSESNNVRESGRVLERKVGDDPDALVVDTTLGRMNAGAVIAVLIAVWGATLLLSGVVLWRARTRAGAARP